MNKRLQSIDLLRGIALILVILCHSPFNYLTLNMGWTAVDLFFVLSGFLVSGLLFNEWIKYKQIHVGRFLIRRGFKIYPVFWLMVLTWLVIDFLMLNVFNEYTDSFTWCGSCYIHELLFIQNYFPGRAFITWSLGVEEHFYISISLLILLLARTRTLENKYLFPSICLVLFITCYLLRIYTIRLGDMSPYKINFPTHLRLDAPLFGTLLAHFFHFSHERTVNFFQKRKLLWILIMIGCFATVTVWANDWTSYKFNTYTIGYTLLYIAYGLLLILLVTTPDIENKLKKWIPGPLLKFTSYIGRHSYSIYLFHIIVLNVGMPAIRMVVTFPNHLTEFIFHFAVSILVGVVTAKMVEIPILKLRDKMYPPKGQKAI